MLLSFSPPANLRPARLSVPTVNVRPVSNRGDTGLLAELASGQHSFDELGDPLRDITFVVVDLETTGGSHVTESITEIGAVKVRGGEVLGEFATLVDPGRAIPPQIVILTGITDAMVVNAPTINTVLPAFLEFSRGTVLVAHNAGFDIGFLKAACVRLGLTWPGNAVVDTVRLARRVLTKEEAPSVRLGLLAPLLGSRVAPDHRALTDARATVDVLHALFERLGPLGVQSLTELQQLSRDVSPARRRKRTLADHLPSTPGVYLFKGPNDEVLYVGTSVNLRQRVRSYFGAGETRGKIKQMITLAERVDYVECAHALEAHIREQRMIAIHQPKYNRRSRSPNKIFWVVLTSETFPRLSIVATPPADRPGALGPFTSRVAATTAVEALQEVVKIRRCSQRLSRSPKGSPCALAELGRCGAPCAGQEDIDSYTAHIGRITGLINGTSDEVLVGLRTELDRLSSQGRFDQAAILRDRLSVLAEAVDRRQRLGSFAAIEQLVTAKPSARGGWEVAVIRYGRLAAAGRAHLGVDPMPVIELLTASAETVIPRPGPLPGASAEETSTLLRWVEGSGARLVQTTQPWLSPARGAGRWRPFMAAVGLARSQLSGPQWYH